MQENHYRLSLIIAYRRVGALTEWFRQRDAPEHPAEPGRLVAVNEEPFNRVTPGIRESDYADDVVVEGSPDRIADAIPHCWDPSVD